MENSCIIIMLVYLGDKSIVTNRDIILSRYLRRIVAHEQFGSFPRFDCIFRGIFKMEKSYGHTHGSVEFRVRAHDFLV